ncbi:hypothetical protein E0H26_25265 [Micromonospora zingiberis]|uniref:Uncharacterized protein n=1 Tax=Micromonospora zingiberis TaxID=2053011 RepID=A0A4R0G9H6_9ACTN|nr:hypothetical protein [Micromonospora zingiberis]TCB91601.1 hypothetical protein E0H26_25265 [Micromonospora zingiberis]
MLGLDEEQQTRDAGLVADDSALGTYAVAISHVRLTWAIQQLAELGPQRLSHLKIRSGEHLAAILLTSFLAAPPHKLDTDGGVDLLFRLDPDSHPKDFFARQPAAAFEVKSVPGPYRRVEDGINRTLRSGANAKGMGVEVLVESAADILRSALPIVRNIEGVLGRKVSGDVSRNGFIIIHPFDRFALETVESALMAPHLSPLPPDIHLDTVWILWFPDHLTMWSRERREWIELVFNTYDPSHLEESDLSVLQQFSSEFLTILGYSGGDPYYFSFESTSSAGGSDAQRSSE